MRWDRMDIKSLSLRWVKKDKLIGHFPDIAAYTEEGDKSQKCLL